MIGKQIERHGKTKLPKKRKRINWIHRRVHIMEKKAVKQSTMVFIIGGITLLLSVLGAVFTLRLYSEAAMTDRGSSSYINLIIVFIVLIALRLV